MAKKPAKKIVPWVKFDRDPKSGRIILSRLACGRDEIRLAFPLSGDSPEMAQLVYAEGDDGPDDGLQLSYSDVQWLAQAIPELMNEMERAGIDE